MSKQSSKQIRLYRYLIDYTKLHNLEFSSSEVKQNIIKYGANINGETTFSQQEWVYEGIDKVQIEHWQARKPSNFEEIKVVFEDTDTLVLNKPVGVVVEPGTGHRVDNLVSYYLDKHNLEVFPAHRLDKDTSGLLILAKHLEALEFYQEQFKEHRVIKKYLAVVNGIFEKVVNIQNWQARDKANTLRQKFFWLEEDALKYSLESRLASSLIQPCLTCPELNQSLIQVQIYTGRMHQIRLQCESLGYSLASDPVYNQARVEFGNEPAHQLVHIPVNNKYTIEHYKQSIEAIPKAKRQMNDYYSLLPVTELSAIDFLSQKDSIFGDREYCLLSNYLEFELFAKRTIQCQIIEI